MTNKYTWEEQKKIVKDYFKLIRKKTMTIDKHNKMREKYHHKLRHNQAKVIRAYLKIFSLSKLKQVIYIMSTSEDEFPRNTYPNWVDFIRNYKLKLNSSSFIYICSNTIEELEYQIKQVSN